MKINNSNSIFFLKKDNNVNQNSSPILNASTSDVFQKSVSFGGSDFLDPLAFFVSDTILGSFYKNLASVMEQQRNELALSIYIDKLSDKSYKTIFAQLGKMKISEFNFKMYGSAFSYIKFLDDMLQKAGINNVSALNQYLRIHNSNKETREACWGQDVEALQIYSKLNNKEDLSHYCELLLYRYNEDRDKENFNPNKTIEFLKKIGLNDIRDFDSKFAHLKDKFNGFESISDKSEAIKYLEQTYDKKISLINEAMPDCVKQKNNPAQQLYLRQNAIIDYLFEENSGESLTPLDSIIDLLMTLPKMKNITQKAFAEEFNGLKTPEDIVFFLEFLAECKITIDDLNSISGKSIISDNAKLDCLVNKETLVDEIKKLNGNNEHQAQESYKKFPDLYNAVYAGGKGDSASIKALYDTISAFNIKNNNDMLNLYNKLCCGKEKSITAQEFREFIDLTAFCDPKTIFATAKAQNKTPIEYLKQERQKYTIVEQDIKDFISSDETNFFLGKTPIEIYREYKELIDENAQKIREILENIKNLNITDSAEYTEKSKKICELETFFADRTTLLDFISNNNIKFDSSQDDEKFISHCKSILSTAAEEDLDYFRNSDFMAKSRNHFDKFNAIFDSKAKCQEVLSVIASKKVPSLKDFNEFIRTYEDRNGNFENVITALKNAPEDIDFGKFTQLISSTLDKLHKLNITSVKIDNENIAGIDFESLDKTRNITNSNLANVLNNITCAKSNENFITRLSGCFADKTQDYSTFKIAHEIATKAGKTQDSYSNIITKFGLSKQDLNLDAQSSPYIYAKALEEVLPQEFINFVNDTSWLKFNGQIPNISLHARLRMIDRFALQGDNNAESLYTQKMKDYLNGIIKAVYGQTPTDTLGMDESKRIVTEIPYDNDIVKTVFSKHGTMISIMPKWKN